MFSIHRAFIDNINLHTLTLDDNEQFSEMPAHLFTGNPNLKELSMKNNKLSTLDAAQLPLDQLKKLALADNPLVCNCSLIWLWQLIKASSATTRSREMENGTSSLVIDKNAIGCDIIIQGGETNVKVRKRLVEMSEGDIKCPTHIVTIISVILTVIFIAIICVSILIVIKCSRNAQLKRRQEKYLTSERQNIGELIIPQKIGKFELEQYLAEQQVQHQQKQLQIQQQYQMNHTLPPNQNQYFQHENTLNTLNTLNKVNINDYRSLRPWEAHPQYPLANHHQSTLLASSTPTMTSSSPLKKLQKNNIHIMNNYNGSVKSEHDDSDHNQNDEDEGAEDHYENFDDSYLNSFNQKVNKINIQSTLPLKVPSTTKSKYNTSTSKKHVHSNGKPHIVYV